MREVTVIIKAQVEDATPPISIDDYLYRITSRVDCFYDMNIKEVYVGEAKRDE